MERHFRPPCILHLTGITWADFKPVEDMADGRLIEDIELGAADGNAAGAEPAVDKIPKVFTTLEDWPLSTNLCCHSCGFTFEGRPVFIPAHVRVGETRVEIGVRGNFCTFNDAALHINTTVHTSEERWRLHDMLRFLYRVFTGFDVAQIKPAEPRTSLITYGGALTYEAFWKKMQELDPMHAMHATNCSSSRPARVSAQPAGKDPGQAPLSRGPRYNGLGSTGYATLVHEKDQPALRITPASNSGRYVWDIARKGTQQTKTGTTVSGSTDISTSVEIDDLLRAYLDEPVSTAETTSCTDQINNFIETLTSETNALAAESQKVAQETNALAAESQKVAQETNALAAESQKVAQETSGGDLLDELLS